MGSGGGVGQKCWGLRGGYAGIFPGLGGGMMELLCAQGGWPELLGAQAGVCRNFCGLMEGYDGSFEGSWGGGLTELLCTQGGYAGTFVGSGGAMPELLWA